MGGVSRSSTLSLAAHAPRAATRPRRRRQPRGMRAFSFDHRVGEGKQLIRYRETEGLRGREVNDQIKFSRLFHWYVAGLGAAQYLIDQVPSAPPHVRPVRPIGH